MTGEQAKRLGEARACIVDANELLKGLARDTGQEPSDESRHFWRDAMDCADILDRMDRADRRRAE